MIFTYLVSKDLVETLERKYKFSLDIECIDEIKSLENRFLNRFWKYIPQEIKPASIDAQNMSDEIKKELNKESLPIVSLDRVYIPDANKFLEVTRLTDQKTGEMSIAQRPGTPPIEDQLSEISRYPRVILTDVGAFEGSTLLKICDLLYQKDVKVEKVILGVSSNAANQKIKNCCVIRIFNFYEWIELRDLFGIDGRNVGFKDGQREFIPYWENLISWASVSIDNKDPIARLCKDFNNQLIGKLWQAGYNLNNIGRPVKYLGTR